MTGKVVPGTREMPLIHNCAKTSEGTAKVEKFHVIQGEVEFLPSIIIRREFLFMQSLFVALE